MKRDFQLYFAVTLTTGLLFWDAYLALFAVGAEAFYFLYSRGVFRLLWKKLSQPRLSGAPADPAAATEETSEPTLITLVARAPHELLGVGEDAGTSTIFHSYQERVKEERKVDLRLNKQGRRLTAAKNAMLSRRRKQGTGNPGKTSTARVEKELKNSLQALLEHRPAYSGKVIQFRNLSSQGLERYQVGSEIEEAGLSGTCESPESAGRGSSRFVIQSQSGRLLGSSGAGEVVFLPGTRFRILSREPWQNPDYPDSAPGFTIEMVEVA